MRCIAAVGYAVIMAAACGAAVPPIPGKGGPAWTELTSDHFTVWTDGDRERVRDLVEQMEHLHQVIVGVTFPSLPAGRTLVVALRDDDELAAFSSTAQARASAVEAGIPLWQPMIALSASSRVEDTVRTVAHELTHVVSFAAVHHQPRWLSEGMAEFFETTRLRVRDGTAEVGNAPKLHGQPMWTARPIPVEQLFAWREVTAAEEREYSTAWELFTYLFNAHREELVHYLQLLHEAGKPRDQATAQDAAQLWQAAFPSLALADVDQALRQWLFAGRHDVMRFTVHWHDWSVSERALRDADVFAARAMLCAAVAERPAEARSDAAAALALEPGNVTARLVTAMLDRTPITVAQAQVMIGAHGEDWRAWWIAAIALSHDHAAAKQITDARTIACGLFAQNSALVAPSKLCEGEPARGAR